MWKWIFLAHSRWYQTQDCSIIWVSNDSTGSSLSMPKKVVAKRGSSKPLKKTTTMLQREAACSRPPPHQERVPAPAAAEMPTMMATHSRNTHTVAPLGSCECESVLLPFFFLIPCTHLSLPLQFALKRMWNTLTGTAKSLSFRSSIFQARRTKSSPGTTSWLPWTFAS